MSDNIIQFTKELKGGGLSSSDFRDNQNRFRTESLFLEQRRGKCNFPAYFTFSDHDRKGMVSMRRVYLEIADPTEHATAIALLGSYKHWQALCERDWFMKHLNQWRVELETKIKSEAIEQLVQISKDKKSGSRVTAINKLLDQPWRTKTTMRGRPSKAELTGYKKQAVEAISDTEADYENVFGDKE